MAKKLSLLYLVFTKLDRASRFSSPCEWELNNIADCDIILPQSRCSRKFDLFGRAELGQDGLEKHEVKEELSKSRKQIEESRLRLTKLHNDGFDLVTSIRVAGDARENARRMEEEEAKRIRKEKLEAEAKAGQERFEEVFFLRILNFCLRSIVEICFQMVLHVVETLNRI